MAGSFNRIDYSVRPAKYAERRMLRDIFRRLTPFSSPDRYCYVGFGSVWFSDFILFHRSLGIKKMISIESSIGSEQRIRDNAPFKIDIRMGRSERILPELNWDERQFIWLDYDDAIDSSKVSDADIVSRMACSGTVYAVTLRVDSAKELRSEGQDLTPVQAFTNSFDDGLLPAKVFEDDLTGYPFSELSRGIVLAKIGQALDVRNGTRGDAMRFQPICSIDYADGCLMTTLVGIFYADSEISKLEGCKFQDLDFIDDVGDHIKIEMPLMTPLEIRKIETQLPASRIEDLNVGSVPQKQVARLLKFYRHFPSYMVAEN